MLQGYKTYIAVAIAILSEGAKAVFPENQAVATAVQTIAAFAGLGFLRAGIKTTK